MDIFDEIIAEIERFKSVAEVLSNERCCSDFIIRILIKHLQTKFKGGTK